MSRLILLGLGEKDVDVFSRIQALDPAPEILVVHPDPASLVLKLARLAELPTDTRPPEPRGDDVVVAPPGGGLNHLLEPWRREGARIIAPDVVGQGLWERHHTADPLRDAAAAPPRARKEGRTTMASKELDSSKEAPARTVGTPRPPDGAGSGYASGPPLEIWESPEATFRYLVARAMGPDTRATLWWDGGTESWVPWLWMGDGPDGRPEDGLDLGTHWGNFRLTGLAEGASIPRAALLRVAEDLALRDLMLWQQEAPHLVRHGLPGTDLHAGALKEWATPVLTRLEVESSLLWRGTPEGWSLLFAQGEGLRLDGTVVFPERLLLATFDAAASPWRRWDPVDGIRFYLIPRGDERRWPLRLARVARALSGHVGGP
jgi:hypothetical protein